MGEQWFVRLILFLFMVKDSVYFISDAHFGITLDGCENREEHFFKFLEEISGSMSTLFIVGDLFDFWIEYSCAIRPDYFNVLHHLKLIVEKGVEVHYLAGNHDFALGSFLTDQVGITVHPGHVDTTIQGKKVHLFHGDGLIKKDIGYRLLKSILRNKINQRLYKLLHPTIGVKLGTFFSGSSRKYLRPRFLDWVKKEYREHANRYLEKGSDIVLFGHTHCGEIVNCPSGIYCNTGSWLVHYNYASMTNGELRLWSYAPGSSPQEISPIDWK